MTKVTNIYAKIIIAFSIFGIVLGTLAAIRLIPSKFVWAGRANTTSMLTLELVTLLTNGFIIWITGMKSGYFKMKIKSNICNVLLYIFSIVMILNTIGNLAAPTTIEKSLSIMTIVSAYCFFKLARAKI